MAQNDVPVWLITGCSTGFGRELAKLVIARGWRAVVTARNVAQVADIVDGQTNAFAVKLDVTDPADIAEAVGQAETHFGRIDVLVNNAGYGYLAAVEEGEDDQIRQMFEANFFGLVKLTNAVLPGMRRRRSGAIINVSSIGGLMSFASTGYYHATKFAVEGISESLAIELKPLGIKVMIVEPGPFRTDWAGRSLLESKVHIDDYAATAGERRKQSRARSGTQPGDPVRGCEAIIKAITSDNPPLHLVLGRHGYEIVTKHLQGMLDEFAAWKDTALSADYPESEGT